MSRLTIDITEQQQQTLDAMARWGEAQCRTCIAKLDQAGEALAKGEGVVGDMGFEAWRRANGR